MPNNLSDGERVRLWHGRTFWEEQPHLPLVPELLTLRALATSSRPYITFAGGTEERVLTFGEIDDLSRRLAWWLAREGIASRGATVAFAPRNDLLSVLTIFALLRAGAITLLLNPQDPEGRHDELRAGARAVATLAIIGDATRHRDALVLPDPRSLPATAPPLPLPAADDGAFLIGTSGSTAASKLVLQTHANAAANAAAVVTHHALSAESRLLGCLPIHHVNGLHFTLFAPLAGGAQAILLEQFDPFAYRAALSHYAPHVASVVPSMLEMMLTADRRGALPETLRYFVSAAAPLQASTAKDVLERFRRPICQGYGLTETTNFSCTIPTGLDPAIYRRRMIDVEIPSIGIAMAGNEVEILDSDGRESPPGEIGELCMRGHNVMAGYFGNAEATAKAFRHGWFHTQDLGYAIQDADCGRLFVITGRTKNMAKVAGEAVSFEEVERVLRALPGVADAAVFAETDRFYGQRLIALLVAPDDVSDTTIRNHLKLRVSPAAQPARMVRVDSLPRTPTGKLRRPQLAEFAARLNS